MRWGVFLILAFLGLVLEKSLTDVLEIRGVRPGVLALVAMYVSLWAPRMTALWAAALVGLLIDLSSPIVSATSPVVHLIGPHVLGYAFASALILQLRTMVFRRQPFAIGFLTALYIVAASIVVVAIYTIRSWYSPELQVGWSPGGALLHRVAAAAYSGLLAIPLGWALLRLTPLFGFHIPTAVRSAWR
jgi:rod shape-determining protein MreD